MKKMLIVLSAVMLSAGALFAAETVAAQPAAKPAEKAWTPFQLVFFPGFPSGAVKSNVRGLKLGIPATGGEGSIYGVEGSFFYSGTSYDNPDSRVDGVQFSWFGPAMSADLSGLQASQSFCSAQKLRGFQAAGIAFVHESSSGVQAALGGVAVKGFNGFQTGVSNVTLEQFNGFQFGVSNVAPDDFYGFQCGVFGLAGNAGGVQCNLVNVITEESKCFQCGIFNYSTGGKGCQLGAFNIIKGGVLPFTLIFNYSR